VEKLAAGLGGCGVDAAFGPDGVGDCRHAEVCYDSWIIVSLRLRG
jgi:hypothetical protein